MTWLRAAVGEFAAVVTEDVCFFLALGAWIAVAVTVLSRHEIFQGLGGPILFLGCAAILIAATAWTAHRTGSGS